MCVMRLIMSIIICILLIMSITLRIDLYVRTFAINTQSGLIAS